MFSRPLKRESSASKKSRYCGRLPTLNDCEIGRTCPTACSTSSSPKVHESRVSMKLPKVVGASPAVSVETIGTGASTGGGGGGGGAGGVTFLAVAARALAAPAIGPPP